MEQETIGTIERLKIIFKYLKPHKKDLIFLSVLGVISAGANGVAPYLVGRLFDAILDLRLGVFAESKIEMPMWLFFIFLWGIAQIVANVVDWRTGVKSEALGNLVYTKYLVGGFSKLILLPLSFHKEKKIGEVGERFDRAAGWLSQIVKSIIIQLPPQFLSIVVALFIVFYIMPILSFVLIAGVILYVLILYRITPPMIKLQQEMHKAYQGAYGDAYDSILNVQTIKQFSTEEREKNKILKNFQAIALEIWNKMTAIWQGVGFYQRIIVTLTQAIIFILSIIYIVQGKMTIGELIMFNGYAAMFFGPFVVLGNNWQTIQNGLVAVEQGEKILSLPEEKYVPENTVTLSDIKGEIELDKASFSYKKGKEVLNEVSFKVNSGEVVALVGESGVGKSTIVDLIGGYYFINSGRVLIDGRDIKNIDLKFLRKNIAVVPQEPVLFNDTIKNNIRYGNFQASDKEVIEAAKRAYAHEFIENFPEKYEQIVGERGVKLSSGQKQRVAIARAILKNAKILILDEPTSALDAHSEKHIQESMEKLMNGRTTFIIAHRLSTVRKDDKILVLEKGRLAEVGKHEDLIKIPNGVYRHFYELQIGLH